MESYISDLRFLVLVLTSLFHSPLFLSSPLLSLSVLIVCMCMYSVCGCYTQGNDYFPYSVLDKSVLIETRMKQLVLWLGGRCTVTGGNYLSSCSGR